MNTKTRLHCVRMVLLAVFTVIGFASALPAEAQFICAGSADGTTGLGAQGASATGDTRNLACGTGANASGAIGTSGFGSVNTAFGTKADAHGDGSQNTATGGFANASGAGSSNTALGGNADAHGDRSQNVATGQSANASGVGRGVINVKCSGGPLTILDPPDLSKEPIEPCGLERNARH